VCFWYSSWTCMWCPYSTKQKTTKTTGTLSSIPWFICCCCTKQQHTQSSAGRETTDRTYFETQSTGMWTVFIEGLVTAFCSAEFFSISKLQKAFECKLCDVSVLWNTMTLSQVSESCSRKFCIQPRSDSILVLYVGVDTAKLHTIFPAVYVVSVILWLETLFWEHKIRSTSDFTMQIFWVSYSSSKKNI
jgi:hypothetical protein